MFGFFRCADGNRAAEGPKRITKNDCLELVRYQASYRRKLVGRWYGTSTVHYTTVDDNYVIIETL